MLLWCYVFVGLVFGDLCFCACVALCCVGRCWWMCFCLACFVVDFICVWLIWCCICAFGVCFDW